MKYNQCQLMKVVDNITRTRISYIPSKYAKLGNILTLKNEQEQWEDGWKVTYVGHFADVPLDVQKSVRNHRKNTGDSLPKG